MKDKLKLKCDCIDRETILNLKLALIHVKSDYENSVKIEEDKAGKSTPRSIALIAKAKQFHILLSDITKMKPCPEHHDIST